MGDNAVSFDVCRGYVWHVSAFVIIASAYQPAIMELCIYAAECGIYYAVALGSGYGKDTGVLDCRGLCGDQCGDVVLSRTMDLEDTRSGFYGDQCRVHYITLCISQ